LAEPSTRPAIVKIIVSDDVRGVPDRHFGDAITQVIPRVMGHLPVQILPEHERGLLQMATRVIEHSITHILPDPERVGVLCVTANIERLTGAEGGRGRVVSGVHAVGRSIGS
jgi:hypothetical protein